MLLYFKQFLELQSSGITKNCKIVNDCIEKQYKLFSYLQPTVIAAVTYLQQIFGLYFYPVI